MHTNVCSLSTELLTKANCPIVTFTNVACFHLSYFCEIQLSLLHSQLLGTHSPMCSPNTLKLAADQNLATFDALSRVHCTECFALLRFHYLQVLITVN